MSCSSTLFLSSSDTTKRDDRCSMRVLYVVVLIRNPFTPTRCWPMRQPRSASAPGDADADSGADAAATDSADTEVEGASAADTATGTEENGDKVEGEGDAGDAKDDKEKKDKPKKKKKKKKTIKVNKTKIVTDRKKAKLDVVPHFTVRIRIAVVAVGFESMLWGGHERLVQAVSER